VSAWCRLAGRKLLILELADDDEDRPCISVHQPRIVLGAAMIDLLDSIGDFIEGRPWVALGWALLCLLLLSALIALAQRRVIDKLKTDAKNKTGEDLRKRDA
jgi:hypothetical protein